MITEDYISFELAKLLKEKEFDVETCGYYPIKGDATGRLMFSSEYNHNHSQVQISAPTLQMTMKWLREVHKLYIVVRPYVTEEGFFSLFDIKSIKEKGIVVNIKTKTGFTTYEEAAETAVKYCLENLI